MLIEDAESLHTGHKTPTSDIVHTLEIFDLIFGSGTLVVQDKEHRDVRWNFFANSSKRSGHWSP